jgi:probable dihydroxyacetone kinase regulator
MPGTNRTKQELAQSLKALMNTLPLERISVGDIVEQAGLGRNTFYYHFQDKYDLVNWIFETEAACLISKKVTKDNWNAYFKEIEDYFHANCAFYCNALAYSGQNCLQDYIYESICAMVKEQSLAIPEAERQGLSDEEINTIGEILACTFVGLLTRWARNEMRTDPRGFHDCLRRIADGSFAHSWLHSAERKEIP